MKCYLLFKNLTREYIKYFYFTGHSVDPHEIGILSSKAPDEYKAFMVAYFKTPSHLRVRTPRATRKKQQESYYDHDGYNPYSKFFLKNFYVGKSVHDCWVLFCYIKYGSKYLLSEIGFFMIKCIICVLK